MSFCRFAWDGSDVYTYQSAQGYECCGCKFTGFATFGTPEELIAHLGLHRRAGHFVPEYAITGLWQDIPGADKPRKPEPAALTKAKKMMRKALAEAKKKGKKK